MSVRRIANFETNRWAGGETRQLYIYPPEARYGDRDFIFRLSTATVETETSDFTPLPDYLRLIAPVEGTLGLSFGGEQPAVTLQPMEICRFDGIWPTRSAGKVRDFNLMLRKGAAFGEVMGAELAPGSRIALPVGGGAAFRFVWCIDGGVRITAASGAVTLGPGELGVLTEADCAQAAWITHNDTDTARLMIACAGLHNPAE